MTDCNDLDWSDDAPDFVLLWIVVALLGWLLFALLWFGVISV
jgi:hypothetical protein